MCMIKMIDILESRQNLPAAGEVLYSSIKEAIQKNDKLSIDMEGVTSLPSILLNVSIGRIIDEDGVNTLKQYVSFVNITQQQAMRLRDYLNRYEQA
ncbi:protein of unknown function [Segatella baroniae B14]|nr:DUF4325 domain-containing protein [Segatella bryantii]SEQ68636.1 protein of unknown function [Segatella baroniae B14]